MCPPCLLLLCRVPVPSPRSILSKGLSCSSNEKHSHHQQGQSHAHSHSSIQPNVARAVRYYIQGLELEDQRSERERLVSATAGHGDEGEREGAAGMELPSQAGHTDDTAVIVAQLNTEVVQDIANGLCILYRHGKIRPDVELGAQVGSRSPSAQLKLGSRHKAPHSLSRHSDSEKGAAGSSMETRKDSDLEKPRHGADSEKGTRRHDEGEKAEEDPRAPDAPERHCDSKRRNGLTSAWERGGKAALPLALKLEQLLGLDFDEEDRQQDDGLPMSQEAQSSSTSPPPLLERHTFPTDSGFPSEDTSPVSQDSNSVAVSPNGALAPKINKTVSFSRLPPKQKRSSTLAPAAPTSLLDAISSRQARSALVHLWYILALVSFASPSLELAQPAALNPSSKLGQGSSHSQVSGHRAARRYWQKLVRLAESQGAGSKEADEIVEKAQARLQMLEEVAVATPQSPTVGSAHASQTPAPVRMGIADLLSPTEGGYGRPKETNGFAFDDVRETPSAPQKMPLEGSARASNDDRASFAQAVASAHTSNIRGPSANALSVSPPLSSATARPLAKAPTDDSPAVGSSATVAGPRRAKAQFAIFDSPTSVKSFASIKGNGNGNLAAPAAQGGGSRIRGNSSASLLSASSAAGPEKGKGRGRVDVPWTVRSPRSSTSISKMSTTSHLAPDWLARPSASGQRSDSYGTANQSTSGHSTRGHLLHHQRSTPLLRAPLSASSPASGTARAKGKSRWTPLASATLAVSDPREHSLAHPVHSHASQYDHRAYTDPTSVASLPHTSGDATRPSRAYSSAHLLLNRNRRNRGSSSSLASFASLRGVQKSFSSLRNFFTTSSGGPHAVGAEDAGSVLDEEEEDCVEEAEEEERKADELRRKLLEQARRHDEAVAEIEAREAQWGYEYRDWGDGDSVDFYESVETSPAPGPSPQHVDTDEGLPLAPAVLPGAAAKVNGHNQHAGHRLSMSNGMESESLASSRAVRPLSTSIPSSSLLRPTFSSHPSRAGSSITPPPAPPGTPSSMAVSFGQKAATGEKRRAAGALRPPRSFQLNDPTSPSLTPRASAADLRCTAAALPPSRAAGLSTASSSDGGGSTPTHRYHGATGRLATGCWEGDEGGIPGPLKIDPLLAALEAASRVNVKSRCAVCGKSGVNFPKCNKCSMTFCSRDCRIASGGEEGLKLGKHVC